MKMQKVQKTEIIQLDKKSKEYKDCISEFILMQETENKEIKSLPELRMDIQVLDSSFINGAKTIYTFDDGLVRNIIQLNFQSPTYTDEGDYSNHIENWCIIACEQDGEIILDRSMQVSVFCMHEGGH